MSVTSEFRVSASVPMPSGEFDRAEALLKLRAAYIAFEAALGEDATCEFKVVNPRPDMGPRKRKTPAAVSSGHAVAAE